MQHSRHSDAQLRLYPVQIYPKEYILPGIAFCRPHTKTVCLHPEHFGIGAQRVLGRFQQVYTDGLAACEAQSQGAGFATLPLPARELILRSGDAAISATCVAPTETFGNRYSVPTSPSFAIAWT